jgi:hypothetical protein
MSVTEIENEILKLAPDEVASLVLWIEEQFAGNWDEKLAEDAESGRLDDLLADVESEYQAGLARPL